MMKAAEGFRGRSKNTIRQTTQRVEKSLCYTYRDRRVKKRDFRSLWIARISAALLSHGVSYSRFINALKSSQVELNRKILADLGASHPEVFSSVVGVVKGNVAQQAN